MPAVAGSRWECDREVELEVLAVLLAARDVRGLGAVYGRSTALLSVLPPGMYSSAYICMCVCVCVCVDM